MSFGFDHVMDILRLYVYVLKHTCHVFFTTLLCERAAPAWRAVVFFPQELQVRANVISALCLNRLWLWWEVETPLGLLMHHYNRAFKKFNFTQVLVSSLLLRSVKCHLCVIVVISMALSLTGRCALWHTALLQRTPDDFIEWVHLSCNLIIFNQ